MWRKIFLWGLAGVGIFSASLVIHHKPKPPQTPKLQEVSYPLADYVFTPPKVSAPAPTLQDYQRLQDQLEIRARQIEQLQAQLQTQRKTPAPKPAKPPPQELEPLGDPQVLEILATRIQPFAPLEPQTPKEKIDASGLENSTDYGAHGFDNLSQKDMATHENKLLRTMTADKLIPAFLITPISSQLAGKVIAQVESDVFANMGRAVLIPKGSKVIGYYNNTNKIGEYRLDIVWTRIITPHGVNIMLTNAKSADIKGYSGLVGEMMTHNFQRYGLPLLVSTLSNGLLIALTAGIANKTGRNNFFGDYLLMQLTRQSGMGLNQIVAQILKDKSNLKPVVVIREGSRVFISPNLDIFFPIPKEGEILAEFFTH